MPSLTNCWLEDHKLWFPTYTEDNAPAAGINLYLPLPIRTKNPLTLRTTWSVYDAAATPAGVAVFGLAIAGKSIAFNRIVPLANVLLYAAFGGGFVGREDTVVDTEIAPYITSDIESVGLMFSRPGHRDDDIEDPVAFILGRLLQ